MNFSSWRKWCISEFSGHHGLHKPLRGLWNLLEIGEAEGQELLIMPQLWRPCKGTENGAVFKMRHNCRD
ncbi:hypothetical protein P8452_65610 [Trifolium repens]|nr:hypothetical protein P8452_65610 [Trifolium repens]